MERFTVSMFEEDIDYFERERTDLGSQLGHDKPMTKSAFLRFLLQEHKNKVPNFMKHKNLISQISELNTNIKILIVSEKIDDRNILYIYEKLNEINCMMEKILND